MRNLAITTGITGLLLLIIRIIGIIAEFPFNNILLAIGLILVFAISVPLQIIIKIRHNQKINAIIESYKRKKVDENYIKKGDKVTKGWGMNNSPFRDRKSGATWDGGNIKAASAIRGTRKSFLK